MNFDVAKLNKLRSMRLSEVIGRGRQEFVKLADRFLIAGAREMSDESLDRECAPAARNGSGEGTAEMLLERLRTGSGPFSPPLAERGAIVEAMGRRFPGERRALLASAAQ